MLSALVILVKKLKLITLITISYHKLLLVETIYRAKSTKKKFFSINFIKPLNLFVESRFSSTKLINSEFDS